MRPEREYTLTERDIDDIKRLLRESTMSPSAIAGMYGVSRLLIVTIRDGQNAN